MVSVAVRPSPRLVVTISAAVLAAAAVFSAPPSRAAAGDLDPTFGSAGRVLLDIDGCEDDASAIAQQADGKLVVGGSACESDAYRPMLLRYTTAGVLDTTFDTDGQVVGAADGEYTTVEPLADGDIVAGGISVATTSADALVVRYSSTGAQEMSFTHHIGGAEGSASVEDVTVAGDGTITAAGTACDLTIDEDFACQVFVMKVTAAGALDTTFDTDGVAVSATGIYGDVALLPDGRVALAGFDDGGDSVVRLYTTTLAPDTTFNTTGSRTLPFDAFGVTVTGTGLLVSGELYDVNTDQGDVAVASVDLTGALVGAFGTGGVAVHDLGGSEFAIAAALDGSNRVYLAGQDNADDGGFVLARLASNGTLDSSFGEGGSVRTYFGEGFASAEAVVVQADGKPVLAGTAFNESGIFDVAIARYAATTPFEIRYTSITPARILDPRPSSPVTADGIGRPLNPSEEFDMQVTGMGGVPVSGVSAVVLNITVVSPAAGGFLSAYPAGRPRPGASNLNFTGGQTVPNLVKVKVGDLGRVTLFNGSGGQTHTIVDVAGWYSDGTSPVAGGTYTPLDPVRIVDSRPGRPPAGDGIDAPLAPVSTANVTVTGKGGIPATGVSAVVLNVTVTGSSAGGFLTAFPAGTTRPNASNLNFGTGQTIANLVIVKVGTGGAVTLFNGSAGTAHVLVDVAGYFTDSTSGLVAGNFQSLTPSRVLDTRVAPLVKIAPGQTITVQISGRGRVPVSGAVAVAMNVTAVAPANGGFLTIYPADAASRPVVSNLNFAAGKIVPNAAIVKLSPTGQVKLYNGSAGSTHVLFDVAGWYNASFVD